MVPNLPSYPVKFADVRDSKVALVSPAPCGLCLAKWMAL